MTKEGKTLGTRECFHGSLVKQCMRVYVVMKKLSCTVHLEIVLSDMTVGKFSSYFLS